MIVRLLMTGTILGWYKVMCIFGFGKKMKINENESV